MKYFGKIAIAAAFCSLIHWQTPSHAQVSPSVQAPQNNYTLYLEQLNNSPMQKAALDPSALDLMQLLANLETASGDAQNRAAIIALVNTAENSPLDPTRNPVLLDAYLRVIDFSIEQEDFVNSVKFSNDIIRAYQIRQCDACSSLWRVYLRRGISQFQEGVRNPPPRLNWTKPANISFWVDAIIDLRKARVIYGRPRRIDDPDYYNIVAWDLAVNGFVDAQQKISLQIENLWARNIINPSARIVETYAPNSVQCAQYGRATPSVNLAQSETNPNLPFGGAVALYDLGPDGVPINIRIVAIVPNPSLTGQATEAIANFRFAVSPELVPEACKTNRVGVVKFSANRPNIIPIE